MKPLEWIKKLKNFFTGGVDVAKAKSQLNNLSSPHQKNYKKTTHTNEDIPKSYGLFPSEALEEIKNSQSNISMASKIKKIFSNKSKGSSSIPNKKSNKSQRSLS